MLLTDLIALAPRLFAPVRAARNLVSDVVGDARDVARVWEMFALHGIVPSEWIGTPARAFHTLRPSKQAHRFGNCDTPCLCDSGTYATTPPHLHDALAIASDVPGVLTAESLVAEGFARLRVWGARPSTRIVWAVTRNKRRLRGVSLPALVHVRQKLRQALESLGDTIFVSSLTAAHYALARALPTPPISLSRFQFISLADLFALDASWERACERGLCVPAGYVWPFDVEGREFGSMPNPITPWFSMMKLRVHAVSDCR